MILAEPFTAKAPSIIRASKYWTPKRMAKQAESSGRKTAQLTGTHIDNLIQLRRVLTLSPEAARKFGHPRGRSQAERAGYVIKKSIPVARSWCDASGEFHPGCIVFFPKELA